jgi:DNA-binding response OmpR family regulator
MNRQRIILATRDRELCARVAPALARHGFVVDVVQTNLELVWHLTARRHTQTALVVVDTRVPHFGTAPLAWLRGEPIACPLVVLAHDDDRAALEAAELAAAARVFTLPRARVRVGRLVRDLRTVALGTGPRELLRWTPPRAPPRLRARARSAAA